jgi:hypothetical protein
MKHVKVLCLLTAAAMALTALAASSASAYTVEVGGVTKNESIEISGSLQKESTAVLTRTDGSFANTCTGVTGTGTTESPFTGETLGGSVKERTITGCTRSITIHKDGSVKIEHISSSTNGTVFSSGVEITSGTPFGTVNCKTGTGTHMGVLTGKASGEATVEVNAVVNCGFLLPSTGLKATLVVTSPEGLGVVA